MCKTALNKKGTMSANYNQQQCWKKAYSYNYKNIQRYIEWQNNGTETVVVVALVKKFIQEQ